MLTNSLDESSPEDNCCPVCGRRQTSFYVRNAQNDAPMQEVECDTCSCPLRLGELGWNLIFVKIDLDRLRERVELFGLTDSSLLLPMDFAECQFLGSQILSKLLEIDQLLKKNHRQAILTNLPSQIREVFEITRLDRVFQIS